MPEQTIETPVTETPVIEKLVHPVLHEYNRDKVFIAKAGFCKGAVNRIEITWDVPTTDEESQKRYGKDLAYLILHGVMELSHAPNYASLLLDDNYTEEKHKACQKLADEYKPGNRQPGAGAAMKVDAAAGKAAKASAQSMGFATLEEALEFAQQAQQAQQGKKKKK